MKQIVRIYYASDFTISNKLPEGYDNQDFIIQLYTTDSLSYYEAKYIEGTTYNCAINDGEVIVYVNNHGLEAGCLHVVQAYDYDNSHFADGIENIKTSEESNVYLVKSNPNSTSAMFVGSALPDLTDGGEYITQTEFDTALSNYVTYTYLESKGYITEDALDGYATQSYVAYYVATHQSEVDLSAYATKQDLSYKQDLLISGINLKKVNGYSLLGSGNIEINTYVDLSDYVTHSELENEISDFVTEEDLNLTLGDFTTYTDIQNILIEASYVSSEELSQMGYINTIPDDVVTFNAMFGYLNDKQDTLVSGTNIKTINGYSLLGSGNLVIEGGGSAIDLSSYVTHDELNQAGYVTQSDLVQAEYISLSDLSAMSYATKTYVADYVGSQIQDSQTYMETYVSEYVSQYAPQVDLSAYVSKTELNNAGYISSIPSEYLTESELSGMGYATQTYVNQQINNIPQVDLSSYVTYTYLDSKLSSKQDTLVSGTNIKTINNNSLLGSGNISITAGGLIIEVTQAEYDALVQAGTLDPNAIYIITDAAPSDLSYYMLLSYAESYYVSKQELNQAGYISSIPSEYITESELRSTLNSYVTKTQLNNAGYITSIPSEYITESELASTLNSYVTKTQLNNASYVTNYELSNKSYATKTYVADYVNTHSGSVDLSAYVTHTELNNAGYISSIPSEYITESELYSMSYARTYECTQAQYDDLVAQGQLQPNTLYIITDAEITDLSYFVTYDYLEEYVATYGGNVDLSAYVTKTELNNAGYISSIPSEYLTESELQTILSAYITESELSGMGYATQTYVADYVNTHSGPIDLSAYVTKTELNNAGYITSIPSDYITESELSVMGYATESYVNQQINNIPQVDLSSYVTKTELNNAGYISSIPSEYLTESELNGMGYATQNYVADYVNTHSGPVDLSAYVTKTELNNAGYISSIPSDYITESELSGMGYATESYVNQQINNIPQVDLSSYVTKTELNNAAYLQSVPSEYLTESELQTLLSAYITESELSGMSYVTQSDLGSYLPLSGGTMSGNITFSDNNTYNIGNSTNCLNTLNTYTINSPSTIRFNTAGNVRVTLDSAKIAPASNNSRDLGTSSLKWKATYTYNIYTDSTGHAELPTDTYIGSYKALNSANFQYDSSTFTLKIVV